GGAPEPHVRRQRATGELELPRSHTVLGDELRCVETAEMSIAEAPRNELDLRSHGNGEINRRSSAVGIGDADLEREGPGCGRLPADAPRGRVDIQPRRHSPPSSRKGKRSETAGGRNGGF